MMAVTYELTATCQGVVVMRQTFRHLGQAHAAIEAALARYLDCDVKLTRDDVVLVSMAPAPTKASCDAHST